MAEANNVLLFSIKKYCITYVDIKVSNFKQYKIFNIKIIFNDKINIILLVEYSFWKNSMYKLNFGINLYVLLIEDFNSC